MSNTVRRQEKIMRQLCNDKGIEIIEGHMMMDHVHTLVMISQKYAIFSAIGYIKGKSSLMIVDEFSRRKYRMAIGDSEA